MASTRARHAAFVDQREPPSGLSENPGVGRQSDSGLRVDQCSIPALDGYRLGASVHWAAEPRGVVVVNAATGVPHRFYRHFAAYLAGQGWTTVTYDYRGIAASRQGPVRRSGARMRDWGLLDMPGAVAWSAGLDLGPVFVVGHSVGGQLMGLTDRPDQVAAMVTVSAQSGHWRYQGGAQKAVVAAHTHLTFPVLAHVLGFVPWGRVGAGEDLPKRVALEWARWCRDRRYVMGDASLPLTRYQQFEAPILALSVSDDDWGTARSVAVMMRAYPHVTQREVTPEAAGLPSLGHVGFFRPTAEPLWTMVTDWFRV